MLYPIRFSTTPDDWPSDGHSLIEFAELVFTTPDGSQLLLDEWQKWLIVEALKRYPHDYDVPRLRGRLVYRQVLISIPRQQGKSLLGAIFGLYGLLLHLPNYAYVIGVASSREQAQIVYQRVLQVINTHPALKRRFARLTDTRGIASPDRQRLYELKATKSAALQGLPISLCVFDEVHLVKPQSWAAVVLGTTTFSDGLVIGITTAGDDDSTLLKDLYKLETSRFGYFIWEAPSDDLTEENVLASNPAVECGRVPLEDVMSDIQLMPPTEAIRYRLNRFIKTSNPWITPDLWNLTKTQEIAKPDVVCVTRSTEWTFASITTASKYSDRILTTARTALNSPTKDDLYAACNRFYGSPFVVDNVRLKDLGERLERDGQDVYYFTRADALNASQLAYSDLARGRLLHTDLPAVNEQAFSAQKHSEGSQWRVTGDHVDLIEGMILASWAIQTRVESEQLF